MEIAEIKEESCSPLDLVQGQNKQILLNGEHCDELNEAVAEWIWLRSSSDIFCKCEQLKHENRNNFIAEFGIEINVAELIDFNALIGNYFIKRPRKFLKLLRWVIFILIKEQHWLQISTDSQVIINPRLLNFPSFTESQLGSRLKSEERLTKIFGTVVSLTPALQYTKGTKYSCPQENCIAAEFNDDFYAWIPGSPETSIVRTGEKCNYCDAILQEDVQLRILGEQQIFKVILNEGITCLGPGIQGRRYKRHQTLTVIARDDLLRRMEIGHSYWITGMLVVDWSQRTPPPSVTNTLEAFCIEQAFSVPTKTLIVEDELPPSIRQLYENRLESPWSFVATLAYHFGDCICIGGAYHKLKLALMLSAVLSGDDIFMENMTERVFIGNELQKIHILTIAEDLITIQRLLSYAGGFCENSILHQPSLDLFGNVGPEVNGTVCVDGGSLLLAGKHACIIQNVMGIKKDERLMLQKALEENVITVDTSKHVGDQVNFSQMTFPLKCTVWAAANSASSQNEAKHDDFRGLAEEFDMVYRFTNEHGLPVEIEEEQVRETMMKRSSGLHLQEEIEYEDIKKFLNFASSRRVTFSQNATELIRNFFLASRRARNVGYSRAQIGKSALQTMMSLAAAHAKLSLHTEVTVDDALVAIMLCEETLTMRTGKSVVDLIPKLHFHRKRFVDNTGSKNDEEMLLLHAKVTSFVRTFVRGAGRLCLAEE